ncbi:MAG: AEC family transporter [Kiritimatiellia bacterium]|nr:AEC family transporter [Kiritimatiellia bacterium]
MTDLPVVVLKISAMFLVMALGWFARWKGYLPETIGRTMSRLLVDLVFPALVFTQMLKTINPQILREGWYIPLLGVGIMVVAEIVALLIIPFFGGKDKKNTAVFLTAMPNWIYLPLPIVQGLFGAAGVRDILLYNVGFQLALWTIGVWTLRPSAPDIKSFRTLALNPGLLATAAGVLLVLLCPAVGSIDSVRPAGIFSLWLPALAAFQALEMLGSLTIPLSLLITGIQLGGLNLADHVPSRNLISVLVARLIFCPLVTVLLVQFFGRAGLCIGEVPRITGYLISAMPVAISCSIVADRFAGDTGLAAKSIFYSTLLSIITVPAFYFFVRFFNL